MSCLIEMPLGKDDEVNEAVIIAREQRMLRSGCRDSLVNAAVALFEDLATEFGEKHSPNLKDWIGYVKAEKGEIPRASQSEEARVKKDVTYREEQALLVTIACAVRLPLRRFTGGRGYVGTPR